MEEIKLEISNPLDSKLKSRIMKLNKKEFEAYAITTSNKNSNQILIDYLNNFPLLSSKYLDFKYCERGSYLFVIHRISVHFDEIKLLNNSMNSKITEFNRAHLEQYYNI
jgi:hypothetical protein